MSLQRFTHQQACLLAGGQHTPRLHAVLASQLKMHPTHITLAVLPACVACVCYMDDTAVEHAPLQFKYG